LAKRQDFRACMSLDLRQGEGSPRPYPQRKEGKRVLHHEQKDRRLIRRVLAALVFLALLTAGTSYGMPSFPCHEQPLHDVAAMAHDVGDHSAHDHGRPGKSPCCDVGCAVCLAIIPSQVVSRTCSGVLPVAFAIPQVLVGKALPPILGPPKASLES